MKKKGTKPVSKAKPETKPAQPETDPAADEAKAAAPETKATEAETQAAELKAAGDQQAAQQAAREEEIRESAKEKASDDTPAVGRRARCLRNNALYGELCIVVEQLSALQVRVKLAGPVFVNDPGVVLGDGEWELLD